jgi:PAS domain S-box-containing protein
MIKAVAREAEIAAPSIYLACYTTTESGMLECAAAPRLGDEYRARWGSLTAPLPSVVHLDQDPSWAEERARLGLRSCVTHRLEVQRVLCGAVTVFRGADTPTEADLAVLERALKLIRVALARWLDQREVGILRAAAAHVDDGIIVTEAQTLDEPGPRIRWVNDAFLRMTGWAREEVIGRSPRFLQGPGTSTTARAAMRTALREERPIRTDIVNYRRDGREIVVELSISPIVGADGTATQFVAIQRDVTEQRALEAQLVQTRAQQASGALAAGVGHQLSNALTVLVTALDALERELPADAAVRRDMELGLDATHQVAEIARELTALSRDPSQWPSPRGVSLPPLDSAGLERTGGGKTSGRREALVIDTDNLLGETVGRTLERAGFVVNVVESAERALDRAKGKADIHLVVVESVVSGALGRDLAQVLVQFQPEARVVILCSAAERAAVEGQREIPWVRCLVKPFVHAELLSCVDELMNEGVS